MADNLTTPLGVIASDDVAGASYQRFKLSVGADGSASDAVGGAGINGPGVQRMTVATDDLMSARINDAYAGDYEFVSSSQTNQVMGTTGAVGDYLLGVLIIPTSVNPGAIQIKDGGAGAITVFAGGTGSISNLVSFYIPLGLRSANGAWQISTGANVSAIGVGNFT